MIIGDTMKTFTQENSTAMLNALICLSQYEDKAVAGKARCTLFEIGVIKMESDGGVGECAELFRSMVSATLKH